MSRLQRWERHSEWPLAAVAVIFLVAYSVLVLAQPTGRTNAVITVTLWVTYAVFVVDYFARLALAENRGQWFIRHLLDLLIVALPLMRPLRLFRVIVLVVALQKAIGGATRGRVIVYTGSATLLLLYVSSLAILQAERYVAQSSINNFGDAIWWSITTITTVGYGEQEPVTTTGRMIATILMIGGISLIGVVTATIASWIVQRVAEEDSAAQAATVAQIDAFRSETDQRLTALHAEIQELRRALAGTAERESAPVAENPRDPF